MDAIKSYILRHGLHPGDRLPTESALCADLGVSRSSVREALRRLQALDIVTVRQGSGSYVGEMSMQPLVETLVQDIAFHSGLLAYIENELMHQLVAAMWLVHQSVTPQLAAASRQEMEDTAEAHAAILRACEAGDLEAYTAAVEAHYAPLLAIIEGR